MRALRRFGAFVALLVTITLTVGALAHPSGAQQLPDGDDTPSCSLFPTRLGFGRWVFTNTKDFAITLQIERADGEIVFPFGELQGGESTPEFVLTRDTVIRWAGGFYHLSAYDFVNCLDVEPPGPDVSLPTTTTAPTPTQSSTPPDTTAPPTTAPPADVEATTPPPATEAPTTEPSPCPGPAGAVTDERCVAPVAVEAVAITSRSATDAATAAQASLPTTGFPLGLVALAGAVVALSGLAVLAIARHRDTETFDRQLEDLRR